MGNRFLYLASNNSHKMQEFGRLLGDQWPLQLASETQLGSAYPPENGKTYRENAAIKALFAGQRLAKPCFSDDSGLEVKALGNQPGLHSARYGGLDNSEAQRKLLLEKLSGVESRQASFYCVIALYLPSQMDCLFFAGKIDGWISHKEKGDKGFGYDSIFIPEGETQSFAEISNEEKDKISHRGRASQLMKKFLLSGSR